MPRVTKTKAPVVATPRRATRSTVRAGSASLEEPIEVPAPRRRGSRSKTPESKNSSFEKSQPEQHLPALAEEEVEQSPRILLPQPIDVAPIVDASPYVTPQHYHIAATRNTLYTSPAAAQSPRSSPAGRSLNKSPAVAQSIHNSPAVTQSIDNSPTVSQLIQQSPISSKSLHSSPATTKSVRTSSAVNHSVQQSPTVTQTVQQTIEIYSDDDETQDDFQSPYDNDVAEDDQEDEEAVQEAAASQLAQETAEAGLSHSHLTSPVLLKSPTTVSSLAGHSSSKRRRSARSGGFPRTPKIRGVPAFDSPLGDISGNSINWREYFNSSVFKSSSPAPQLTTPLASELIERAMNNEEVIPELTERQSVAVLLNMRREILRLRKIEEQFLASKQPQSVAKAPQSPAIQEQSSPEIPRTISRLGDLRYQRTIATPARKRLLAQREAEKAEKAAAAAAAAEAEKIAEEEEQNDQTPSRSVPSSTSRSGLSSGNSKRKASQHSTPEAQTPQPSSQNSASAETPTASPAWGLTSLFGSVKRVFTHRPNFSPIKQVHEQPQEQSMPQSQQAAQQHTFTPSPVKNTRHLLSSSQQSPTPKPRAPAPPATPAPTVEEVEDDGLYGQTPRTQRRRGYLPGSQPRRKRDTPAAKPKETNADFRASQLALGAQRTAEREQAQEKADRLERERLAIVEELKLRDSAYNVGDKRKMQVNVDDLAVIPRKAAGASSGTYGLLDDFFHYDDDSDIVEMDEDEVQLLPAPEHPTKRVRLDENVFQPKTPAAGTAPAPQATAVSPIKQGVAPRQQQAHVPATPAPNYSELTQQAIDKQRSLMAKHIPKQPSRLRMEQRLSAVSSVGASSPQQPITAPVQNIEEVAAPVREAQEVAPVAELPQAPGPRVINWPELGPPMTTPEGFARADKIYTPELKALDHEFYMKKFAEAMDKSIAAENEALARHIEAQREFA